MKRLLRKQSNDEQTEALDWLQSYTSDTFFNKSVPPNYIVEELQEDYPLDSNTTLYRGINFRSEEQYNEFINSIEGGILETIALSSWSKSSEEAESFALSTMIDNPDLEVMRLYQEQQQNKEKISGYRGIILQTDASPEMALVDVTKTGYSREEEVILLPNSIQVSIYKELKSYKDDFSEMDINDYVLNLSHENLDKKAIDYIVHHHSEDFNNESKDKLYELFKPKWLLAYDFVEDEKDYFDPDDKEKNVVKIYLNDEFLNKIYPLLTEDKKEEVKDQMNGEGEELAHFVNNEQVDKFDGVPISEVEKYVDKSIVDEIAKPLQEKARKSYEDANNNMREDFRNLKGTDAKKRMKEFLDHIKML